MALLIAGVRYVRQIFAPDVHQRPVSWTPQTDVVAHRRPVVQQALGWLLIIPVLLGFPKISKAHWKRLLGWFVPGVMVSMIVSYLLVALGYQQLRQGPLVIVEYVLFPLAASFSPVGETLARRCALWNASRGKGRPWAWLKQVQGDIVTAEH